MQIQMSGVRDREGHDGRPVADHARAITQDVLGRFVGPESDVVVRLEPDAARTARRRAEMAYESVWERITEWAKVLAIYRWL